MAYTKNDQYDDDFGEDEVARQKLIYEKSNNIKLFLTLPVIVAAIALGCCYTFYNTLIDFFPTPITMMFSAFIVSAAVFGAYQASLKLKRYCPEAFCGYTEDTNRTFYYISLVVVFLVILFISFAFFRFVNIAFDKSSPKSYFIEVTEKEKAIILSGGHSSGGRPNYDYYIYTEPIPGVSSIFTQKFEIHRNLYAQISAGDYLEFEVKKGFLGFPYILRGSKFAHFDPDYPKNKASAAARAKQAELEYAF